MRGRRGAVSCGHFVGNKADKTTLMELLCSSMSAQPPPKSRIREKRYARQSRPGPPQTRIIYAPDPTGETNGQAPHSIEQEVQEISSIT